jgi:hypothetical protein
MPNIFLPAANSFPRHRYGIGDWYGPSYVMMVLTYASVLAGFEGIAQVFSVVARNPMVGMLLYMNVWFAGERERGSEASAKCHPGNRPLPLPLPLPLFCPSPPQPH